MLGHQLGWLQEPDSSRQLCPCAGKQKRPTHQTAKLTTSLLTTHAGHMREHVKAWAAYVNACVADSRTVLPSCDVSSKYFMLRLFVAYPMDHLKQVVERASSTDRPVTDLLDVLAEKQQCGVHGICVAMEPRAPMLAAHAPTDLLQWRVSPDGIVIHLSIFALCPGAVLEDKGIEFTR